MPGNVVIGQKVAKEKLLRAKELRKRMTPQEKILWEHLRTNRLGGLHFRRQQVIDGFIADFYCHESGLAIEIDGPSHQADQKYDQERDQVLTHRGFRVLRIKNREIRNNLEGVLKGILSACRLKT